MLYDVAYLNDIEELREFIEASNHLKHEIIGFTQDNNSTYTVIFKFKSE